MLLYRSKSLITSDASQHRLICGLNKLFQTKCESNFARVWKLQWFPNKLAEEETHVSKLYTWSIPFNKRSILLFMPFWLLRVACVQLFIDASSLECAICYEECLAQNEWWHIPDHVKCSHVECNGMWRRKLLRDAYVHTLKQSFGRKWRMVELPWHCWVLMRRHVHHKLIASRCRMANKKRSFQKRRQFFLSYIQRHFLWQ